MPKVKVYCPSCGLNYEWQQELPKEITCHNCKTIFSPANHVIRFSIHIYYPGSHKHVLESHHYSKSCFLPRPGDYFNSKYANLPEDRSFRVTAVEHEFDDRDGWLDYQRVHIYLEDSHYIKFDD